MSRPIQMQCPQCRERKSIYDFPKKSSVCHACHRLSCAREAVRKADADMKAATEKKRKAIAALDALRSQERRIRLRREHIEARSREFDQRMMARAGEKV